MFSVLDTICVGPDRQAYTAGCLADVLEIDAGFVVLNLILSR